MSPVWKIATLTASPGFGSGAAAPSGAAATGKLCSTRGTTSRPARFTCPRRALGARFGFFAPKRGWTAVPAAPLVTCTMGHGPASITVTGTCVPSSLKRRAMPSLRPMSAFIRQLLHLDLDIHASRQIELRERIDRLRAGIQNIDQPLVRLQLELLAALLIDVRAPQHGPELPLGRQRDRSGDLGAGLFGRAHDVGRGLVDQRVVERFETDADLAGHRSSNRYFLIFVTTPAPTVRPPSRIAKRRPSSIAIGVISSIAIFVLSPGITTFLSGPQPTISTSSPTLILPRSIRPVATVPRPVIENTSSTGIRNGLSTSRLGTGMLLSSAVSRSHTLGTHCLSPSMALSAEPRIIGTSSPGNSYFERSSRTSSSTRSSSSASSTKSHLFRNTTIAGTFTWRASRMCSRVCGVGPSTADTNRIAPSLWAAPVIMFFT